MIPIELEKQKNIRDLGGTVTRDGRTIRPRRFIRSGRLSGLTFQDASVLLGQWQVRTIVDLRCDKECRERPDPYWPIVEYFHIPILSEEKLGLEAVKNEEGRELTLFEKLLAVSSNPGFQAKLYMEDLYRKFVSSVQGKAAIRRFFDLTMESSDRGSILFHCNGGKDRTGIITVLLLTALDVPWPVIEEDYSLTNRNVEAAYRKRVTMLPHGYQSAEARNVLKMLYLADRDYLSAAVDEMKLIGDTPLGYLQKAIGLDDRWLESFRARYLR